MIIIPEHIWERMLAEFRRERRKVEQMCYFDGIIYEGGGVVTTLTIPDGILKSGSFEVTPTAMSQAGKHLRAHRLRRFAQIHTHPGAWTGHSGWDDERAYSHLPGAISIVLPRFARDQPTLGESGVHVRTADAWNQLNADEVSKRLRVVPSFFDFRASNEQPHEQLRLESPRRKPWWKILTFRRH